MNFNRPWDHSDPTKPAVWMPGFGPCICEDCKARRTAHTEYRAAMQQYSERWTAWIQGGKEGPPPPRPVPPHTPGWR